MQWVCTGNALTLYPNWGLVTGDRSTCEGITIRLAAVQPYWLRSVKLLPHAIIYIIIYIIIFVLVWSNNIWLKYSHQNFLHGIMGNAAFFFAPDSPAPVQLLQNTAACHVSPGDSCFGAPFTSTWHDYCFSNIKLPGSSDETSAAVLRALAWGCSRSGISFSSVPKSACEHNLAQSHTTHVIANPLERSRWVRWFAHVYKGTLAAGGNNEETKGQKDRNFCGGRRLGLAAWFFSQVSFVGVPREASKVFI